MTINERFDWIIKILFKGNKRAFAKAVGISPTVVENIVGTRKGNPSYEVLCKVCANTNISAEWILFGDESSSFSDIFTFRKELELTAPYINEDGSEGEMKTFFEIRPSEAEPQPRQVDNPDLVEHLTAQLKDKEVQIGSLHEKIGRLKERNEQLERENEELQTASNVNLSPQDAKKVFSHSPETQQV